MDTPLALPTVPPSARLKTGETVLVFAHRFRDQHNPRIYIYQLPEFQVALDLDGQRQWLPAEMFEGVEEVVP